MTNKARILCVILNDWKLAEGSFNYSQHQFQFLNSGQVKSALRELKMLGIIKIVKPHMGDLPTEYGLNI